MEAIINTSVTNYSKFEEAYIRLRESENRLFSDKEVLLLPDVSIHHPHYNEWKIRKKSSNKLFRYLKSFNRPLTILEVGCGNGWLSALMAEIPQVKITGIDVNRYELNQAQKLFSHKENLQFMEASIETIPAGNKYDIILFASSIQYFSSIQNTVNQSLQMLSENGELHIIDSTFYQSDEVENARKRSSVYFSETGHNDMTDYYYHHSLEDICLFNITILKKPSSTFKFLFKIKDPFYWIRLRS